MAADDAMPGAAKAALRFFSIESPYRRKTRFYPSLIVIAMLIPAAIMLGIPLSGWLVALAAGGSLAVSTATVGLLTHMSSAAGNRFRRKVFTRWPHDAPTNLRLHPSDKASSKQQKEKWYEAIRRLTGIDIASIADDNEEAERAINDAIVILRTKVFHRNKLAERLEMHLADFGFARNFAGLRPAWLMTSFSSCVSCWIIYAVRRESIAFPIVASVVLVFCILMAFLLNDYVRHTANHYADSFFGLLQACDEAAQSKASKKTAGASSAEATN